MAQPHNSSSVLSSVLTSTVTGSMIGAIRATWIGTPSTGGGKAGPAIRHTGRIIGRHGMLYGFVFGGFSVAEAAAEQIRESKDIWNGIIGGLSGGAVYGAAVQSLPLGVGAGALLAATSAIYDASGGSFQQGAGIDDGQTPRRLDSRCMQSSRWQQRDAAGAFIQKRRLHSFRCRTCATSQESSAGQTHVPGFTHEAREDGNVGVSGTTSVQQDGSFSHLEDARKRARNNVLGALYSIVRGWGRAAGGGGNGDGWLRRFRDGDGDDFPKGFGSLSAFCFMLAKALVCWCSADPAFAGKLIDVGFLFGLSLVAIASLTPALTTVRPLLVELALMHIGLELLFYGFLIPLMDPSSPQQLGPAMCVHHVATIIGGLYMLSLGRRFAVFHWCSVQLLITEITSFLPVAFHQALHDGLMDSKRQAVIAVVFPMAFIARTLLSMSVTANFVQAVRALGPAQVEYWPVGAFAGSALASLNVMWTYRILKGTLRAVQKRMKLRETQAPSGAA